MVNTLTYSGLYSEFYMNNFISENISYLVKEYNLKQDDFGLLFDLKKGVVNQYIQKKSLPKIETLQKICQHFKITLDDFVNSDLALKQKNYKSGDVVGVIAEPATPYNEKELINSQRETIEAQKEAINAYKNQIKTLRSQLGHAS